MKKTVMIVATGLLAAAGLKAQTIQEGVNHLYADRFKSAINVFEKLLAANPNNIEATYWLGQTYLDEDRNDQARQLYDKALTTSANAPLLLVGRGHVDLLDKKTAEAKQKFETALTMSKGKKGDDPAILNAVGRANVDAKLGDLPYAIQKLEMAVQREPNNPDIYVNLGNAYRKAKPGEGGGQAYTSYKKALELNPNFPLAYLRLAKLFEAQKNWELNLDNLNKAIAVDPKFSPAYYELFYYNFFRKKFDEAETYLKKYIDSRLPETYIDDQRMYAELCWGRKDFNCAISKAEGIVTSEGQYVKPKVLKLLADSYNEKGDSINAKKYIDWYFTKEKPEDMLNADHAFDHALKAEIYFKFPGQENVAFASVLDGVRIDTTVEGKVKILTDAAEKLKAKGLRDKEAELLAKIIEVKPKPTINDYFYTTRSYYFAKMYDKSRAFALKMIENYPTEVFGYEWAFNNSSVVDTVKKDSIAVPDALKLYEFSQKDTTKFKKQYIVSVRYLAGYYINDAKDKEKAIEFFQKWKEADVANAPTIQGYIDQIQKSKSASPKGGSAPKSGKPTPESTPKKTATTKVAVKK
ncbi:MAG TPA: tetratricopeptide repeat protein [Chitinophagaceae bacterium]